ncbi:hypothetical protein BTO01_23245 [Vibrio jasicida]|uniref:hypothetical protein n=1 Tax=Vibrio jasicida TaxID=766224 RepID=UPI000CF3C0C1|nr:hypothetical protein [Vibrio jasicida]PQJ55354.1 hypothetical protein BTO01_23245 [Vibrio jasicida]
MSGSIKICHITSLCIIEKILEEGKFKPNSNIYLNSDNGLNCFNVDLNDYTDRNDYGAEGVKLYFEWSGSCSSKKGLLRKKESTYYEEHPHRGFIQAGISTNVLKVIDFEIYDEDKAWEYLDIKNLRIKKNI